jgi:hypothetical protein
VVAKFKRWVWALMAAPFFGAFAAHPCLEHLGVVLLGVGIAALGMRKQHCCVDDCISEKER